MKNRYKIKVNYNPNILNGKNLFREVIDSLYENGLNFEARKTNEIHNYKFLKVYLTINSKEEEFSPYINDHKIRLKKRLKELSKLERELTLSIKGIPDEVA